MFESLEEKRGEEMTLVRRERMRENY